MGGVVLEIITKIVCNRMQHDHFMVIGSSSFTSVGVTSSSISSADSSCETRTGEVEGYFLSKNPARSTEVPPPAGGFEFYHAYMWGFGDWC